MPMIEPWFVLAAVALFAAAFVYGAVGFGAGLVAIPLLLMAGLPLPEAMVIVAIATVVQGVVMVRHMPREVDWGELTPLVMVAGVALVVGNALLIWLTQMPRGTVRQVVGGVLLAVLLLRAVARVQPRAQVPRRWGVLAFGVSGLISGLCGMGGPPLVLWVHAHRWSSIRTRATLLAIFMMLMPLQVTLLTLAFGWQIPRALLIGVALIPAMVLGSVMGSYVGDRLSKPLLARLTMGTLVVVAIGALVGPWL